MKCTRALATLVLLGLTATACGHPLGRKTLSEKPLTGVGRSLLDVDVSAAQSSASQTFVISSNPSNLQGGECFISGFPGSDDTPVQGPLKITVGVGSYQNVTFNLSDGPGTYRMLNMTGDVSVLTVNQTDSSGLNQITFQPNVAGQTVQFVAGRYITTVPPRLACQVTIEFTAVNEIDISAAQSAAQPYFDVYSSEPDARSDSPIGGECYIKGYPGNTDSSLPAVKGPMQINVTVGNSQYIGFKQLDSSLYYSELVANTTNDTAFTVSQNSTYGLIGMSYTPTQANVGKWSTFVAAHYLNGTTPVLACTITLNFSAVPAASPPGPNPTPNPYNPTPNPYNPTPNPYNPTPNPTSTPTPYNPTPVPTKKPHPPKPTPTPTPTQTPTPASPPNIGTCVGPTTCKCENGFCFNDLGNDLTSICTPPEDHTCTDTDVSPAQVGPEYANGKYPGSVNVCKCTGPPTPPAPAPAPVPPPIGTCVGPTTCACLGDWCFNNIGNDLTSICTPPEGYTQCSSTSISPGSIGSEFENGYPASVDVCKCTVPPSPPAPAPIAPTSPPIGTCVGPTTCTCQNGFCYSDSGSDLTSICTPPGGQQCSLTTVAPAEINPLFFAYPPSVSVCSCGAHTYIPLIPPPTPAVPANPPTVPANPPTVPANPPTVPANPPTVAYPPQTPAVPQSPPPQTPPPTSSAGQTPPPASAQSPPPATPQTYQTPPPPTATVYTSSPPPASFPPTTG